jgi:cell division protein FtsX
MTDFEWSTLVIGLLGVFVTVGLSLFGWGFSRWARVMDNSTTALDMEFGGIGAGRGYVHVDDRQSTPVSWGYD